MEGDYQVIINLREFIMQHLMSLSKVNTLTLSTSCKTKDTNMTDFYDQFIGFLGCLAKVTALKLEVQQNSTRE